MEKWAEAVSGTEGRLGLEVEEACSSEWGTGIRHMLRLHPGGRCGGSGAESRSSLGSH